MAKTKVQKKDLIDTYVQKLKDSKAIIILRSDKVTATESAEIKKSLFDFGSSYNVVKNTLFKIALEKCGLDIEEDLNLKAHSVVFIKEDISNASKLVKKFTDEVKVEDGSVKLEVVSGYLDGAKLSKEQVIELADMPDTKGSIALILGILDQAIAGVANVLEDPVRSYAQIIDLAYNK